jgi:hypothetical protein
VAKRRPPKGNKYSERVTNADDKDFIELARKRFQQAEEADEQQRERELADLQFYAGEQWDPNVRSAREGQSSNQNSNNSGTGSAPAVPPRPTYTINKVREPVRQVLNQERQADLGVEIAAADDFGSGSPGISPEEIELREGLVRRIQRESQAADARSWAFQRAVIAGRGFYRVMTRYIPGRSNDQELYVDRIFNQASVSMDPAHEQPDGSDAEWGFIGTDLPWDRYQAEYGEIDDKPNPLRAASESEWRALGDELPGWFTSDGDTRSVRIVEYWYTERVPRTLVTAEDGRIFYEDDAEFNDAIPLGVDDNGDPLKRSVLEKRIKWAKLDGVQVLEETDWPGKYIPIIKVLGEELQPFDSERRSEGMVRPARDAQKGFNVMVSKWVEQIGLAPIPPWMGPAGFDEGFENEYLLSATRTIPALHFNPYDVNGNPIAPPQRTSITTEIQAIAGSVQLFDQAIKSTTAIPDPTLGNIDPSLKSGKAIRQVLDQATRGTSHYLDNLSRSIRYEGLILNDLLYPIYNRKGRTVRTMNPRGETQASILHSPFVRHPETQQPLPMPQGGMPGQPPMMPPGVPPDTKPEMVTLTPDATFNVTVKVTKSYDTRREEQETTLSTLINAEPQLMGVFGDLLFKYNDGPGHDELEERAKAMLAPPVQAILKGGSATDPQLQQAQQQIQQLTQMIQGKVAEKQAEAQAQGQIDLQKQQLKGQQEKELAQLEQQGKERLAWINQVAQIAIAGAKIDAEQARTFVDAAEKGSAKALDLHMQHLAHVQDTQQSTQDHLEALQQAALEHSQALEQGQQGHQQALEQGAMGHQQGLEANAQQAALQPATAEGVQ